MTCKLNLIEVVVLGALLGLTIGIAAACSDGLISTFHVTPWVAVPIGAIGGLVVIGGPVAILSLIVHHLDRRLERRLKSRERNDARDSED
jgi:hypothetical protein